MIAKPATLRPLPIAGIFVSRQEPKRARDNNAELRSQREGDDPDRAGSPQQN